jgi:hypothetical protein
MPNQRCEICLPVFGIVLSILVVFICQDPLEQCLAPVAHYCTWETEIRKDCGSKTVMDNYLTRSYLRNTHQKKMAGRVAQG